MGNNKTKLALVISGAVSLGSYQAGVIYELFKLMQQMGDNSDFEVNILTGVSAGSVNSVIFVLALMYDYNLIEVTKNIWLEGLDIAALVEQVDEPWNSLFSNRIIKELKRDLLQAVTKSGNNFIANAPDKVKITLTLSNLSGIPYYLRFNNKKEGYKLTTFADWYSMELRKGNREPEVIQEIERMIDIAIASGAFPFAFPAQRLKRKYSDYQHTAIEKKPDSDELDFIYVDGGVFNNEPINRAKELAATLDTPYTQRIYLLVDPTPPEPLAPFDKLDMISSALRLSPAILTEAHFRDWYEAIKVNQRLEWQQNLVRDIKENFSKLSREDLMRINSAMSSAAEKIAQFKADKAGIDKDDYLEDNKVRINSLLTENRLLSADKSEPAMRDVVTNFMFVLECISDLRGKKVLDIRLLSPNEKGMLAGDFLANFGGFFSPKYRIHDFNIGRVVVRDFVQKAKEEGGLGIDISGLQLEPAPFDPELNNVDIKDAPAEHKIRLRDNIIERVDTAIADFLRKHGVGVFARLVGPIVLAFVSWSYLIRRIVRTKLKDFLNSRLGIEK